MNRLRDDARALILVTAALCGFLFSGAAGAATAEDLNKDAEHSLEILYKGSPIAQDVSRKAKAVLVFPNIVKAGLIFGGAYGEGVLLKGSVAAGYYNSVSASWGLQAGAQSYGYAVFLMNTKALTYLDKSDGWELGVGPTVVVVNEGVAKNLSTSTLKDDAYAFIFDQQGLMASLSIEGTKVTRIKRGSAPAATPAAGAESAAHRAGDYIDDSALTAKVKAAFLGEKNLKSLALSVESTDGVVTLSGKVASSAQIDQAMDVAKRVKGVKDVRNALTLVTDK